VVCTADHLQSNLSYLKVCQNIIAAAEIPVMDCNASGTDSFLENSKFSKIYPRTWYQILEYSPEVIDRMGDKASANQL
jgi:biotin carboxylase